MPNDQSTGAENVRWDLTDLYPDEQVASAALNHAQEAAGAFSGRYRTRIAGLAPSSFSAMLDELELVHDEAGRVYTFAYLRWVTDTADARRGAFLQRVKEAYSRVSQQIVFFDVEFAGLAETAVARLLDAPELASRRHYLELQWLNRRYLLTEPEEKILAETSVNGRQAWHRYFDETISAMRFGLDGESLSEQEVLARLHDLDRETRRAAALSFTEGLKGEVRTLTYITNTLAADKASSDRLRGYESWISSRNVSNEIDDASVEALVSAVTGRYDLARRFYDLKRSILGYTELLDYDRYAPVGESSRRFNWDEARTIVLDAYGAFDDEMGRIAGLFFEHAWIDAAVVAGKRGGAFSHGAVPSVHPYVLMNYTGRVRDVQTLAHELGHGVHQYLSRRHGIFHADTPLTTAETASVFGEMLVFDRLLEREPDEDNRLSMLVGKIDDTMATVFRQITMNRFEDRVHQYRRAEGELTADELSAIWLETQSAMFGDSVTLGEHYALWWSYIPHFLHTPGYVYAYAFGELLVLALHQRYKESPAGFADRYRALLSAGGSNWPHELLAPFGIDLRDAGFWADGLAAVERMIGEAEALAGATTGVS